MFKCVLTIFGDAFALWKRSSKHPQPDPQSILECFLTNFCDAFALCDRSSKHPQVDPQTIL